MEELTHCIMDDSHDAMLSDSFLTAHFRPVTTRGPKTELGMAHYEVRKYPGWHHHMMLTMLAHFFLWPVKGQMGKKSASADRLESEETLSCRLTAQKIHD
jgi:hypothetical protein